MDLIILSLVIILDSGVLKRVLTRKYVYFDHLRVFGCMAYIHVPKDGRYNLHKAVAKSCIFMQYGHEEFAYRLCDLV